MLEIIRIVERSHLPTILDDYPRDIVSWKLCATVRAQNVTDALGLALEASGCNQVHVLHQPRVLADNGPRYVAGELAEYLADKKMRHVCGATLHPHT
jgi:transposase InsO family protein